MKTLFTKDGWHCQVEPWGVGKTLGSVDFCGTTGQFRYHYFGRPKFIDIPCDHIADAKRYVMTLFAMEAQRPTGAINEYT